METIFNVLIWLGENLIWINIILAIILVFFERRNPTTTMLWLMVLLFLPGIGFLLYLFLGQDLSKQKIFKSKEEEDNFESFANDQIEDIKKDNFKFKDPNYQSYSDLVEMHLVSSKSYFSQDNSIEFYHNGEDKFAALLESINNATSYIYMEYYIYRSDNIGGKILDALTKKVEEGLEVKLLVDGMGGRTLSKKFLQPFIEAGGEVGIFLPPIIPLISIRINYRNHRKITVIDGREAYLGGFNVGDEYLGLNKKFGYWRDTHMKIKGSAIGSLQWRFFLDWRFITKEGIGNNQSYIFSDEETPGNVGIQIVTSGPDSKWPSIKDGYFKMVTQARDKLYIQTPYFIPDDSMLEALRIACLSGIDVKVMIPNKPDHPFVYWASLSYIGELLQAGVKCYTYEKGFLHSKVFIMDEFVSSVGTANLDIRSFKLNFEVNGFLYDSGVNLGLTEQFNKDLLDCKEITIEGYSKRSNLVKIKESISRLLSPIL